MTARTKSTLLLLGTLLIGMLLGVFVHTLMVENRIERLTSLRSQAGFVKFMDKMIEPTDDAQREAIRDVLEGTAERLGVHHAESREAVEEIMESFRASVDSLLTEEQIDALNERMERMRHHRKDRGRRDSSSMHRGRKDSSSMNHGRKGAYSERSKGGSNRHEKSPESSESQ